MFRLAFVSLIPLALAMSGCQRDSEVAYAVHHQSVSAKPLVAIVPVVDNTKNDLYPWNLSEEFTTSIYSCLAQGSLFLEPLTKVRLQMKQFKDSQNPFGTNFSWIKQAFNNQQFAVFLELVQHEEVLKLEHKKEIDPKTCPADLNMSMRVRVFDLRGPEPKVVLQELVNDTHFIPRQFTRINFQHTSWDDESFGISPLGIAHSEFVREISTRIEDYILLSIKAQSE